MKVKLWPLVLLTLFVCTTPWTSCKKWDLQKTGFLEVHTIGVVSRTYTTIIVSGEISKLPEGVIIDQYGMVFSYSNPEPTLDDYVFDEGSRSQDGSFQTELYSLTVDAPIYVRAFTVSESKVTYGEVLTAEPEPLGLQISMDSLRVVNDQIKLYGFIQGLAQGVSFPAHGFVWSKNPEPTVEEGDAFFLGAVLTDDLFMEGELLNPDPLETYYVRAFVYSGPQAIYSSEVFTVSKGNIWRLVGDFPAEGLNNPRYQFIIDNELYIGFLEEFGTYDPESNTWVNKSFDHPQTDATSSRMSLGQEGIISSKTPGEGNWKYHAPSGTWSQIGDLPQALHNGSGFVAGGEAYIGLGSNPQGDLDYNFYRYNPATEDFELKTTYPSTYRYLPAIFEFGDKACLALSFFETATDCWCYSPSGGWDQIADFPVPLSAYNDLHYFTIGHRGYVILPDDVENFWEYNSLTNTWTRRPDFPGGARERALAFSLNGKGYFGMGWVSFKGESSIEIWEYIPDPE